MNNELMHYGVLGMKWGHRKAKVSSNSKSTKKNKKKTSQQTNTKKKIIDKGRKIVDALNDGAKSGILLSASLDAAKRGAKALEEKRYFDYMKEQRIADDYWIQWEDFIYR